MNLVIDHGNTSVKIYIFDNQQIIHKQTVSHGQAYQAVAQLLERFDIESSIYSCVGKKNAGLEQLLADETDYMFFDLNVKIPIKNSYKSPTLGTDRLAAAVGANFLYPGENLLICDIGTAITLDVVTGQGEFTGGNISPGPHIRFKALNDYTANLPLVEPDYPVKLIADTTREAILNGVIWGIVYEIEGYIENLTLNFKKLRTILTGGYAYFFEKIMKSPIFVEMNLVPIGLNRILEFNK